MLYSEQINPSSSKVCSVVVFVFRMKWQIYKPVPKLPKSPQQSSRPGIGEKTLGEGWQRAVVFNVWGQSHKEECGLKYNLCFKTVSLEEGMLLKKKSQKGTVCQTRHHQRNDFIFCTKTPYMLWSLYIQMLWVLLHISQPAQGLNENLMAIHSVKLFH